MIKLKAFQKIAHGNQIMKYQKGKKGPNVFISRTIGQRYIAEGLSEVRAQGPAMVVVIKAAIKDISDSWERCDDDTGEECVGLKCKYGEHRAAARLQKIVDKLGA